MRQEGIKGVDTFSQSLSSLLEKSIGILHSGMTLGSIRINVADHQALIQQIKALHSHRIGFEALFADFVGIGEAHYAVSWNELEKQDDLLDAEAEKLLVNIEQLTMKVAATVEKQERDFMIVNAMLGMSAFAIGGYLTLYTILSFRRKVGSLRGQIESLHRSMSPDTLDQSFRYHGTDELDELEKDLKILMARFSLEKNNRDEVETQLIELATRDKLTGAFNRHKWDEQIKAELALANRGHHFSLILLDVDHFKTINDSHGHDVGDNVLKLLVKILRKRLRETDMLFRIGGEEFAVLLRDTHLDDAHFLAEQLRKKISILDEKNIPIFTISLGVTEYQDFDDQSDIVKRADTLLYQAKGAGRNRVVAG
ncbi:diguanylate cyclase [Marinomonas sp. RS-M-Aa-14]|uniref:GGDEF domain-containing protein n=1 Tax=Marinomonas sp. RS-M-Aa-14 TaxID=3241169 RepID=UPI003AAA91E0